MNKKEKTGGRTIGTPNRTTAEIREQFQKLVSNNIDLLENDIIYLNSDNQYQIK